MHNRALHDTLVAFVEEAAAQLAEAVAGGAEVPFELMEEGRPSSPLYCYRPLVDRFIAERVGSLSRLPSYPAVARQLELLPDLESYLQARGRRPATHDARALADLALTAFLATLWEGATDFVLERAHFEAVYTELEGATYAGVSLAVVLAPVEGLVLESDDVSLGGGLALLRGAGLRDAPPELRGDDYATVVRLELQAQDGKEPSLEAAGRRLRRLQTALRLWDPAEPAIGPVAWARADGGWLLVPLAGGLRRHADDCLLAAEEEDPLRAFCSLVARRMPRAGELAWALRRFELGCERPSALEALTDWSHAARALLGEGDGPDRTWERLAAICAGPQERDALAAQLRETAALERRAIAGVARSEPALEALVDELADHLRAVLRDVLCGHLEPELRQTADELLAQRPAPGVPA